VEGVTYRVELVVPTEKVRYDEPDTHEPHDARSRDTVDLQYVEGDAARAARYVREELRAGARMIGPAVVTEELSTTYVPAGQVATIGAHGEIVIRKEQGE
jgi:N-methylhydantoinase A